MTPAPIRPDGAIIKWHAQPVERSQLRKVLTQHGYIALMPEPPKDGPALKAAMTTQKGKNQLVERTKARGKYEVADVERDDIHNYYTTNFTAEVEDGRVSTNWGSADTHALQGEFDRQKMRVSSTRLTAVLDSIVLSMKGSNVGAGCWLPDTAIDNWKRIANDLDTIGVKCDYFAVVLDEDTLRTVARAISERIRKEAEAFQRELTKTQPGERRVKTIRAELLELHKRADDNQELLGSIRAELNNHINVVEHMATLATLQCVGA